MAKSTRGWRSTMALAAIPFFAARGFAEEIRVMTSGAFTAVDLEIHRNDNE